MASFSPMSLIKRAISHSMTGESRPAISVGDKFHQSGQPLSVWVVERISEVSASSLPLISLSREGRPDIKKILSLSVLQEGEDYRPTIQ